MTTTRLVVLDMAGTTIDDRDEVYRVLRAAVEREGATVDDAVFQRWMGTEKRTAIRELLTRGGVEADQERVDGAFAWFLEELAASYRADPPVPLPGVEGALSALREAGIKVALTTGFSRSIADLILEAMGWSVATGTDPGTVDASVCADEVAEGRPAPLMIQEAMRRTGITSTQEVVSVGDTVVDVESAQRAGVRAVGVLTGRLTAADFEDTDADLILDGVRDLPSSLAVTGAR